MSFLLFGFLVFGLIVILFVGWTVLFNRKQFAIALAQPRLLLAVNAGAVVTFTAYLTSVQLIEPAITYTISSGTMPITAYVFYRMGFGEGESMRNRSEAVGNLLIFCSILFLGIVTVAGLSGFVRGGTLAGLLGVLLAGVDGVFFTLILVYSQRLNRVGLGPGAVLGVRLPLYVIVTGCLAFMEADAPDMLSGPEIVTYVLIGLLLTVPPLYLLQRAVPLISTLTLSALTALGPFVIFALQLVERRVGYSDATMIGLSIYFCGALLLAYGAVRGSSDRNSFEKI